LGDKAAEVINALKAKITTTNFTIKPNPPLVNVPAANLSVRLNEPPSYKLGEQVATRQAYGTSLVKLGRSCDRVIAMDGDTKNSTFAETYKKEFPNRYIECYIAEQNLVGVGIGAGCRQRTIPFVSTFASFFTRAFDHLRMGQLFIISQINISLVYFIFRSDISG
jgi:transketolase